MLSFANASGGDILYGVVEAKSADGKNTGVAGDVAPINDVTADQAMQRLGVDYLDLYFCHRADPDTPIGETVWAMHNLITQGKVLYWGTSEWAADEISEAYEFAEYSSISNSLER